MNIGMKRKPLYLIFSAMFLVLLFVFQYGCAGRSLIPYVNKDLDATEGLKMAILPFDNLSETQGVGKKMESFVLVEFLKASPLKIIEPGEVKAALSEERIRLATSIPKETVRRLGKTLGVDLFIIGTVLEYTLQLASGAGGRGEIPVVAITMRVIEAETGNIFWAVNAARRGTDKETIFGIGKVYSSDKLAQDIASEVAEAFAASLRK